MKNWACRPRTGCLDTVHTHKCTQNNAYRYLHRTHILRIPAHTNCVWKYSSPDRFHAICGSVSKSLRQSGAQVGYLKPVAAKQRTHTLLTGVTGLSRPHRAVSCFCILQQGICFCLAFFKVCVWCFTPSGFGFIPPCTFPAWVFPESFLLLLNKDHDSPIGHHYESETVSDLVGSCRPL